MNINDEYLNICFTFSSQWQNKSTKKYGCCEKAAVKKVFDHRDVVFAKAVQFTSFMPTDEDTEITLLWQCDYIENVRL